MLQPDVQSICILRLSAIGDVCNAIAAVQAIQRRYPNAKITWIIGKIERQLLQNLSGIRFVVFDKSQGWRAYRQLKRDLAGQTFDYLLHMQLAFRANLAALCVNARVKVGFPKQHAKELHSLVVNQHVDFPEHPHVLDGFAAFAKFLDADIQTLQWHLPIKAVDQQWAKTHLPDNAKILVLSPSASKQERNWTTEGYIAIGRWAIQQGFDVVLCGGPGAHEKALASTIAEQLQSCTDLTGKTTLQQMLAVLKQASVVIAPDTGPAHMANALGTPVVGLYAHSNPQRTGPYRYQQYVVNYYPLALQQTLGKRPDEVRWGTRAKGETLMHNITVDDVKTMLTRVIEEQQL